MGIACSNYVNVTTSFHLHVENVKSIDLTSVTEFITDAGLYALLEDRNR